MRNPQKFTRFSNPVVLPDGQNFALVVEAENGSKLDIEIPFSEIGTIIEFFASLANHVNLNPSHARANYSPIPVQGLGFSSGRNPNETLLVVRLASSELAFALDSKRVAELALDFSRTAQALSANDTFSH